jgi:hypothetical protein
LADVPLFDLGKPADAREPLERAIDFARRESLTEGRLARHIDRIRFKLTLALAVAGRDREASQVFASATGSTLLGVDQQYRELAKSAMALARKEGDAGESLAKIVLAVDPDRASRDDFELAFLAARLFYSSPANTGELAQKVLRRHTRLTESIGRLAEDRSLLEYLRPHYDALIESAVTHPEFPAAEIGHIALEARTPRSSAVAKDSVIFYFQPERGWAIDIDSSGAAVVLPIPFGSRAIIAARGNAQERSALAQLAPEPLRQRLRSIPAERVFLADPVIDIVADDLKLFTDG